MLTFAPKFLGQIRLARHTSLGQKGKTVQDLRDLIPKTAVKIPTPSTFGDLNVGDYLLQSKVRGGTDLLRIVRFIGNETEFEALGSIGSPREYDVGDQDSFFSTGKLSSQFEVYRPSVGDSSGIGNGTMIIGGLTLAAIAAGAIYFTTRS